MFYAYLSRVIRCRAVQKRKGASVIEKGTACRAPTFGRYAFCNGGRPALFAGQLRLEYGLCFIDIIRLEDHGGLVLRPALDVSVEVFDIDAGFGQRLDDAVQKPARDIGDVVAEQGVDPRGEAGSLERIYTFVRVIHNHADDAELRGVADGEGQDADPLLFQGFKDGLQVPRLVLYKYGYLLSSHLIPPRAFFN